MTGGRPAMVATGPDRRGEPAATPRRFGLADALILLAGTAAFLALARYYWLTPRALAPVVEYDFLRFDPTYERPSLKSAEVTASLALAALSPALLAIGLRRPRPSLAEAIRRPGLWACLVGTVASWGFLGNQTFASYRRGGDGFAIPAMVGTTMRSATIDLFPLNTFPGLRAAVGPWMVAALVAMLPVGRWRGRAGWAEAAGRCVGASWLLLYAASLR